MGSTNVATVLATARRYGLTNVEVIVATMIANVTLDDDGLDRNGATLPARTYFGGWQALAESLPEVTDPRGPSARRYVARVMRNLVAKGVLERVSAGHRGHRSEYRLTAQLIPSNVVRFPGHDVDEPVDNSTAEGAR